MDKLIAALKKEDKNFLLKVSMFFHRLEERGVDVLEDVSVDDFWSKMTDVIEAK